MTDNRQAESVQNDIRESVFATGAVAVGFAEADEIDPSVAQQYDRWIASGSAAGMDYLARHAALRRHPRNVLENVRGVVCAAYSYAPAEWRSPDLPQIASYAYGLDYHDVLRQRLQAAVEHLKERLGGEWRICIDTAPIAERYWAMKSGIGRLGKNGSVIVDNFGSYIFLVEILTTLPIASRTPSSPLPSSPSDSPTLSSSPSGSQSLSDPGSPFDSQPISESILERCIGCDACLRACPQGALRGDGTMDARRCLNYLTIEHRGAWEGESAEAMQTPAGQNTLYGCDICQRVCPHNHGIPPTQITEFSPLPNIMTLDSEEARAIDQSTFSRMFKGSPVKRAKLTGFLRNALNLR